MVLSIIDTADKTSSLLDNLSEADFDNVSVIMKDEKLRDKIGSDKGPLKGIHLGSLSSALTKFHVLKKDIRLIVSSLQKGRVLVAIQTDTNSQLAAIEMVKPYKPKYTKAL